MIVCHCKSLSDREIRSAVRRGATSRRLVTRHCGAGAGCGGCHPVIEQIVEQHAAPSPDLSRLELAPAR